MKPTHYHLIGIGGAAMTPLAGLLKAAGHIVTGSDQNVYPPMSTQLDGLGIRCHEGYRPANLEPRPDVVVVGNAISRGNPELEAVLDLGLYYTSAAVTVREQFLRGRHVLAVAGTHGKTTTASILAWILDRAGLEPSFLIGGIAENFGSSFRLTDSRYFVIEADEYDTAYFDKGPKMWHYLPRTAVVTNIEFDHADVFRDEIAYRFAFEKFINLVPRSGTLVAGWESPAVRELAPKSFAPVETFAIDADEPGAQWTASDIAYGDSFTRFLVRRGAERWGIVETPLAGAFNIRNCLAGIAAACAVGAEPDRIRAALGSFRSVRRRMELRGEVGGVTIIDDFAHHPTAVHETVLATRQRFRDRRVVAVFEPRSYTAQRREFQAAYESALAQADEVIIAGLFRPERYDAATALDPDQLVDAWRARGLAARYEPDTNEIVNHLAATAQSGDVVLIMSNGAFGGIHERLMAALQAR